MLRQLLSSRRACTAELQAAGFCPLRKLFSGGRQQLVDRLAVRAQLPWCWKVQSMYDSPPCKEVLGGAVRECANKHLGRPPSGVKVLPDCPLRVLMLHNSATSDAAAAAKNKGRWQGVAHDIISIAKNKGGLQGGVISKASQGPGGLCRRVACQFLEGGSRQRGQAAAAASGAPAAAEAAAASDGLEVSRPSPCWSGVLPTMLLFL